MPTIELRLCVITMLTAILFICIAPVASLNADEKLTLEEIVRKMDYTITGYDDQYMLTDLRIFDVDGTMKLYTFEVWQKGQETRLVRFISGEMKGMAMLAKDRDNVWMYLPGFKRIRRLAAGNLKQSFAGSDFSNEDMAIGNWGLHWNITLDGEDEKFWRMTAKPKADFKTHYGLAKLVIRKEDFFLDNVEYFDQKGEKIKTWRQDDMHDFSPSLRRNRLVSMIDARSKHKTELYVKEMKVNQGLKDSLFTKRSLQWGR